MAETLARHFADATVEDAVVRLGFGNVEIECRVHDPNWSGAHWSASLFMYISGGRFGPQPIFASISGYHDGGVEQAVIEGTCMWACSFGPVLVSALTGAEDPEVEHEEVEAGGRRHRLVYGRFDRAMTTSAADGERLVTEVRARLGGQPYLTPAVLDAVPTELLADREVSLLSVFVLEGYGNRTVEIKVNGADTEVAWPKDAPAALGSEDLVLLRELAVVVPLEEPARSFTLPEPLDRPGLEAVLDHLGSALAAPGQVAGWRGWRSHGGRLGPTIEESQLARIESSDGRLPEDFRRFLAEVAGPGAGPGYGLLQPRRVGNVVPLAQAGCNAVWVLDVGSDDYGSVWVDSTGVDGRRHRVADSFTAWYHDWLDHALLGRGAWTHWDGGCCAVSTIVREQHSAQHSGDPGPRPAEDRPDLSGTLTELVVVGWNDYLPSRPDGQVTLDHCQGCAETLARHNVSENVVKQGVLSALGSVQPGS